MFQINYAIFNINLSIYVLTIAVLIFYNNIFIDYICINMFYKYILNLKMNAENDWNIHCNSILSNLFSIQFVNINYIIDLILQKNLSYL